MTRLDGEIVVPFVQLYSFVSASTDIDSTISEEPFDSLVRSWRITNRTINQRNSMLNNARAALAISRTDAVVETDGDLVRELELVSLPLHRGEVVLIW